MKPVYALNGLKSSNTRKKKYSLGRSISFSPIGIALRNIKRDKKGVIGIVVIIIVTVYAVNFGIISWDVAYSQKDNNDYWIGIDPSDVIVNVTNHEDYEEIKNLVAGDDRVARYYDVSQGGRVLVDWDKIDITPSLSAFIYDDYRQLDLPVTQGRNPQNAKEIAIASTVAAEHGKTVGDYFQCYIGYGKKVNLLITGIFQTYYQMGDACRLTKATYEQNEIPVEYNMCSIYLKDSGEMQTFIKEFSDEIGNKGEVIPRTEAFASIMNMIVEPQKKGIPPVIVLAFIIGAINIFCVVILKNAANEKVNGIYKSIGYATSDLIKANLYYVGIVAVVSIMIAVPLSIITYPSVMKVALSVFGFTTYPMNVNVIQNVSCISKKKFVYL